jgi:hypothetical protein
MIEYVTAASYSQSPSGQLHELASQLALAKTQSAALSHATMAHSAPTKLLELPLQHAGQLRTAFVSLSTLSTKQGVASLQLLGSPSQVTD